MSMRGKVTIAVESPEEWVQEVLPGFEALTAQGLNVRIERGYIRLTKTQERRTLDTQARNRGGGSQRPLGSL